MDPLRILLVDDSPKFLESAMLFLEQVDAIEQVTGVQSAQAAFVELAARKPHLVLMDIAMPGMNGLEATRRIKEQSSKLRVVILTLHTSEEYRQAALEAGADGFIPKSELVRQLATMLSKLFGEEITGGLGAGLER